MRLIGCITVFVTTASVAGATPPLPVPPVSREARMAELAAHPRYYAFTGSGAAARQDGTKVCMGGEALMASMARTHERARDPKTMAAITKGCTHTYEHGADGSFTMTQACDQAAGAPYTSRMTMSGTAGHWRQHMEVTQAAGGAPRTVVSDLSVTYLGDCPANLKAGQMIDRDGKVTEPFAKPSGGAPAKPHPGAPGAAK